MECAGGRKLFFFAWRDSYRSLCCTSLKKSHDGDETTVVYKFNKKVSFAQARGLSMFNVAQEKTGSSRLVGRG